MFTLTFVEPSGRREVVPLADEERGLTVGRDAGCDVVLQSKEVSRRHARFFVREGALHVEDLGAHNGVYLAGAKAEGPTPIVGTPTIELGDVTCTVAGSASSRARPAAPAAVRASAPAAPAAPSAAPQGSARAGALAARARAANQEQAKGAGKGARPALARAAAPAAAPSAPAPSDVVGIGAGAALRSLAKGGAQIVLPAKATVGRGADCDLVLDDDSVSRHHAELVRDDRGLYRLRDLGSANGTFIDGRPAEPGELIPEGAKLRFGDVELLFWKPPPARTPQSRQRTLLALLVLVVAGFGVLYLIKQKKQAEREALEAAQVVSPEDAARTLAEQAQAALESDRFEEAARLAQSALDKDPLATAPRRVLAQARREQDASKLFTDAQGKAALGDEDEALRIFAQIDPQSRFFARARIKAKDLSQDILRKHGKACLSAAARERWDEADEECTDALDVKCQVQEVDADAALKALRRAEKALCAPRLLVLPAGAGAALPRRRQRRGSLGRRRERRARAAHALSRREDPRGGAALRAGRDRPGAARAGRFAAPAQQERPPRRRPRREDLPSSMDASAPARPSCCATTSPASTRCGARRSRPTPSWSRPASTARSVRRCAAPSRKRTPRSATSATATASTPPPTTSGAGASRSAQRIPHLLDSLAQLEKVAEGLLSGNPSCHQI